MVHFADTFSPAPDVLAVVRHLLKSCEEFAHVRRARIGCVHSQRVILDRGAVTAAQLLIPAQISSKQVERTFHEWALARLLQDQTGGELPDFVLFTDAALWSDSDPLSRERLVFHELSHIVQKVSSYGVPLFDKGTPLLKLRPHDAELFFSELERYGRLVPAFDATALSIAAGAKATRPHKVA